MDADVRKQAIAFEGGNDPVAQLASCLVYGLFNFAREARAELEQVEMVHMRLILAAFYETV